MPCKIVIALVCFATTMAAQSLPAGTALPISLGSSLNSKHDKAGQKIDGKLMQEVILTTDSKLKSGSHVTGHVVSVTKSANSGFQITLQFDQLQDEHTTIPLNVSLRAMAAAENIFQAGTPVDASSTNESSDEWVTKQVGGDVVFRGRGYVASANGKVGRWTGSGVWGKLTPTGDCASMEGNSQEQSLWVFSTTACGIHGFEGMKLTHAGNTDPLGQITLQSPKSILVRGGSGWMLVVNPAPVK